LPFSFIAILLNEPFGNKKIIYVVDRGFCSSDDIKSLKEEKLLFRFHFQQRNQ